LKIALGHIKNDFPILVEPSRYYATLPSERKIRKPALFQQIACLRQILRKTAVSPPWPLNISRIFCTIFFSKIRTKQNRQPGDSSRRSF